MKTISILGSGWLGKPLAQHLCGKGYLVKVSTTSEYRIEELKSINVEPFIVDITDITEEALTFFQSKKLIVNIPTKDIDAFRLLISEIEKSAITNVVFVSSTSVYADRNKTITESDTDTLLQGPLCKIERLFLDNEKFRTTIVRLGGLIGYSRNPGKFFRDGKIVENSDAPVNLIHRDDCIGIISNIIENEVWGEIFNCCADTHPTKREFYTKASKSIGENNPAFSQPTETNFKIICNEKVKKTLNYRFIHPDLMNIKFT